MSDAKERRKVAKARHTARMEAEGRRRLTLRVPDEHVAAHREAAAGRPQELERLREFVEAKARGEVRRWLDRWNRMALRRAARAEARRHPAGSNAPPARIRFGTIPPEEFRKRLREAGWWYDWIAAVWNLPEDPDRWPAVEALIAEAEASGVPFERLAPGPGIEGLDTPPAPPPSLWRRKSGRKGKSGGSFKDQMRIDQRRQISDLKKRTPKESRVRKAGGELCSLHVWARAADVEAHQLAAWQPHALARLRDRLVAELAPKVRAEVVARMSPWGSPSWQRGCNRRSALERINSRIDRVYGMEGHFVRGRAKMALRCNLIVAVMMATALGHVRAGRPEMMRSLVRGPDLKAARGPDPTAWKPCRTRRRAMRRARDSGPGPRSARNRRSRAAQGSMRTGTRQRKWLPQPMVTVPMSGQGSRRSRKTLQRKCLNMMLR